MNEIEQLRMQIAELMAWKSSLESSNAIPRSVETAFRARLGNPVSVGTSSAAGTGSVFIGGVPTSISIPPFPSQKVPVTFPNGETFNFYAE